MPLDLGSVTAKLKRASDHLKSLHDATAARLNSKDYSVTKQLEANGTRHSWIFHAHRGTDFTDLSLILGDCLYNLRCALDHLVYAIAAHEEGVNPPTAANRLDFPISCDARKFHDAKRSIASLSAPVRAAIESVQPYNRPHPEYPPLLGLLGTFNNTDKHRLLQVVMTAFSKASFGLRLPPGTIHQIEIPKPPKLKDGAKIITFIFSDPMPAEMTGNFEGELIIAVPHQPGLVAKNGTEIRSIAEALTDEVKGIIRIVVAAVR